MNEVDTTGIEPMPHAIPVYNVMREDVVKYEQTKEEKPHDHVNRCRNSTPIHDENSH